MAMDFPSSPANGATYQGYTFDGTAWNYTAKPGMIICSDTPPANPPVGQEWFRTTVGQLYVYVDDGTSKQWVQCAGGAMMVPGAWEPIVFQDLVAFTSWQKLDLGAFHKLRLSVDAVPDSAAAFFNVQVSTDNGASWLSGSGDYYYESMFGQGAVAPTSQVGTTSGLVMMHANIAAANAGSVGYFGKLELSGFNKPRGLRGEMSSGYMANGVSTTKQQTFTGTGGNAGRNALRLAMTGGPAWTGNIFLEGVRG